MRVLITGAGGQLGRELVQVFGAGENDEILPCTRDQLDLASHDSIMGTITSNAPEVIIHAGAYTAVDNAESDVDTAYSINAMSTRSVVQAARIVDARVVYLSTDYVFDGTSHTPYREWDQTNPQSVYGRTKLAGETELRPEDTIVRTSWVFGRYGNNIAKTLVKLAQSDRDLTFVNDQFGKPTCAEDLAHAVYALAIGRHAGTFHVTNQDQTTWFDFAQDVFRFAGADPERIKPVTTAELQPPRPAPRPKYSVLDNGAFNYLGFSMSPHRESAERVVKELLTQ